MEIGTYLTGAFGQSQELYKARNELKRDRGDKKIAEKKVEEILLSETKKVISLQEESSLNFIIDPMFKFFYLFQPFVENFPGVEEGSQENWFNNNVFYRRPKFNSLLAKKIGFTSPYLYLDIIPKKSSMAILPSPYSLLMLSDPTNCELYNKKELIENFSFIVRSEAEHLVSEGIKRIQYDEPAIVVKNSLNSLTDYDLELLNRSMEICGKINNATTSLHTYFGDANGIIPYLINLNVDCIGIDCIETPLNEILKNEFHNKEIALGLVDSRSTYLEDPKELAKNLEKIAEKFQPDKLYLTPNTATEYRGYTNAISKLKILREAKEIFNMNNKNL